jgi:hypothetical protein
MFKHFRKVGMGLAALMAIAVGASGLAQAGTTPQKAKVHPATKHRSAVKAQRAQTTSADGDNVQSGDQSAPDSGAGENANDNANGQAESTTEQSGSDGPGGHADEPGAPNADHQFSGNE